VQVPDWQRILLENGAFCSAEDWDVELWRASVLLTASPIQASFFAAQLPPPRLAKSRLYTSGALPAPNYGASAGGFVELATLYLLRDPKDPLGTAGIQVRQREFYGFWATILQPGGDLITDLQTAGGGFVNLLANELQNTLQGAASTEIWTD
jgi:hypothetical protein